MRTLRAMTHSSGRRRQELRRKASAERKRMIRRNRHHPGDDEAPPQYEGDLNDQMSPKYREDLEAVRAQPGGEKALGLFSEFWGIPYPPEIRTIEVPGPDDEVKVMVGMGRSPAVNLADGPKGKGRKKRIKKGFIPAVDPDGKEIWLLTGKDSREAQARLKPAGFVPVTEYIPTNEIEDAGSFKRGAHWVHKHDDEGGEWPEVYQDQAGNYRYAPGTYEVGKWIRRN